jgi:transposase
MSEESKPGQEEGGGREEEGIAALGRRVGGIDVGSKQHWVCAPAREGKGREVQVFGATTAELEKMAAWLLEGGVESVALESTGVYWIPVHEVLEGRGLEVVLVDTRALARAPGRTKTDRRDCEWIQRLHSCGLLRGAFRPPEQICILRTLVRDKGNLVAEQGDWVRRMR